VGIGSLRVMFRIALIGSPCGLACLFFVHPYMIAEKAQKSKKNKKLSKLLQIVRNMVS